MKFQSLSFTTLKQIKSNIDDNQDDGCDFLPDDDALINIGWVFPKNHLSFVYLDLVLSQKPVFVSLMCVFEKLNLKEKSFARGGRYNTKEETFSLLTVNGNSSLSLQYND